MKQFRRFGKLLLVAVLIVTMLALTACGASKDEAADANGRVGDLSWDYKKETHTLTVHANGNLGINDAENASAVPWYAVRDSVQKVVVEEGVTSIGNYAFYYMPALTEVVIPESVTRIGKCAFAFCASLKSVVVPKGVTIIEESAFEACSSLTAVRIRNCATLGARAFALCRSLEKAYIFGDVNAFGKWTFKDCSKLSELAVYEGVKAKAHDPAAFEGSSMTADKITGTASVDGISSITVSYLYADGSQALAPRTGWGEYGTGYHFLSQPIGEEESIREGFEADRLNVTGLYGAANGTTTVYFTNPNAPADPGTSDNPNTTDTPSTPTESDKPAEEPKQATWVTILSITIMVVVLIAIGVGAFLLIRSDKKGNSQTVRKNQNSDKKNKK